MSSSWRIAFDIDVRPSSKFVATSDMLIDNSIKSVNYTIFPYNSAKLWFYNVEESKLNFKFVRFFNVSRL
jgi:hypothetical protein